MEVVVLAIQYRVEITYTDETTEEYIIHSDKTVEWIQQQKTKTADAFVTLFVSSLQITSWFVSNNAKKFEVTAEEEA